jgi:hypothetical protein
MLRSSKSVEGSLTGIGLETKAVPLGRAAALINSLSVDSSISRFQISSTARAAAFPRHGVPESRDDVDGGYSMVPV